MLVRGMGVDGGMGGRRGQDGLFDENVGPSLYAKAQGMPVKIWGFLGNGRLEYYVLAEDVDEKGRKRTTNMAGGKA